MFKMFKTGCNCLKQKTFYRGYMKLAKDVVVYEQNGTKALMSITGMFGLTQLVAGSCMSYTLYQSMPAFAFIPQEQESTAQNGKRLRRAEWKYRLGLSLFTSAVSAGILTTILFFNLRSVRTIRLLKDGERVVLETFTPWGTPFFTNTKITNCSAMTPRTGETSTIPLKVNGKRFNYLVDKSGKFLQSTLFDRTVGIKRTFDVK